jgi:hypothetical protein
MFLHYVKIVRDLDTVYCHPAAIIANGEASTEPLTFATSSQHEIMCDSSASR